MTFYFPNVDPIYLHQRRGTEADPYIPLEDVNFVRLNSIVLKEVPSFLEKVKATSNSGDLTETEKEDLEYDEFRVDYSVGVVFFNELRDGDEITLNYIGTGYVSIPSHRVVVPNSETGALESLQNILDDVDEASRVIAEVSNMKFVEEYKEDFQYRKWNFVSFDNATFVALKDIRNQTPHETSNWQLVSTGIGFTGIFKEEDVYSIGTLVADEGRKNFYISLIMGNDKPLTDESAWDLILTLDDTVKYLMDTTEDEIRKLDILKEALIEADSIRDDNDLLRDNRVDGKISEFSGVMDGYAEDESNRETQETSRQTQEDAREEAENNRKESELDREKNEQTRKTQEASRTQKMENLQTLNEELTTEVNNTSEKIDKQQDTVDELKTEADIIVENAESILGNIGNLSHENEYSETTSYEKYNIVIHEGSSYIAIQDVIYDEDEPDDAVEIDDDQYWRILAEKGRDGTAITVSGVEVDPETNDINLDVLGFAESEEIQAVKEDLEDEMATVVGDLTRLKTAKKESVVDSINELQSKINDIIEIIS